MTSLNLLRPSTVQEAVTMLAGHGDDAKVISGGTALVPLMHEELLKPAYLVALYKVPGLDYISYEPEVGLRIGALTSLRDVETSPLVRQHAPVLSYTTGHIASVRVRSVATVGGSLAEANYASDPHGVLITLDAKAKAIGTSGKRSIEMCDFVTGHYETTLQPHEVITELFVPEVSHDTSATYIKYTTRSQKERPAVGVASLARLDGVGTCEELKVVVTAAAETPQEIAEAEQLALNEKPSPSLVREIALRYSQQIEPLEDHRASAWYRRQLIEVLVRRGLQSVLRVEGGHSR
ncbi:MAG TPA: xanthine dehydrogenase family protein subunit M [Rubrobacteraceae bacterium]|jgi:carbon-monoxide dehydrogenase medium subunit|nr:xanthine dehydrogenase family protein subunit M [Rubrobacteraceae bacterium]